MLRIFAKLPLNFDIIQSLLCLLSYSMTVSVHDYPCVVLALCIIEFLTFCGIYVHKIIGVNADLIQKGLDVIFTS